MKTFHPTSTILIPASSPHPPKTEYKVSIGVEFWNDTPNNVIKVQMVYDGKVEGRKSPSYPVGTDDFLRVNDAIGNLTAKNKLKGGKINE